MQITTPGTDVERWLDWTRPAAQLRNQVRGWGSQGALATIDGQTYRVDRARTVAMFTSAHPGALVENTDNALLVQAGQPAWCARTYEFDGSSALFGSKGCTRSA